MLRTSALAFRAFFACALLSLPATAITSISVSGRQLLVGGAPFVVRGVNYKPTPTTGPAAWGDDWALYPPVCAQDFAKMQEMGANVARVYVTYERLFNNWDNHDPTNDMPVQAEVAHYQMALPAAASHGIWMVMNYWLPHNIDYTNPAIRAAHQTRFRKIIHLFKDANVYPNVLMWALGNENNLAANASPVSSTDLFKFFEETIAAAKSAEDSTHPYTVVLIDNGDVNRTDLVTLVPSVDLWSMTVYQTAAGFDNLVRNYTWTKPFLFMEFGQDAYNNGEDQNGQAAFYTERWSQHIAPNLSASSANKVLVGGCIFEWNDEWWKAGNNNTQDSTGVPGNDDGDHALNEEWFGIGTALPAGNPGPRTYRKAFDALKAQWTGTFDGGVPGTGGAAGSGGRDGGSTTSSTTGNGGATGSGSSATTGGGRMTGGTGGMATSGTSSTGTSTSATSSGSGTNGSTTSGSSSGAGGGTSGGATTGAGGSGDKDGEPPRNASGCTCGLGATPAATSSSWMAFALLWLQRRRQASRVRRR